MRQRTRAVVSGAAAPSAPSAPVPPSAGGHRRGAAIVQEAEHAQAVNAKRREQMNQAQRFWLKGGEESEIIVLDKSLQDVVAFYEHQIWDAGNKTMSYEYCLKDLGHKCPLCDTPDNSNYYVMFLTIIELRAFTTKKGVHHPWSKKLLPVKLGQMERFRQLAAAATKEAGSMRGMYMVMKRAAGDKTARIGEPEILDNGKLYDLLSEETLLKDYGHAAIMSEDKKTIIKPENWMITAFDYDKMFPKPNADEILKRYGVGAARGSTDEALKEFGESGDDDGPEEQADPAPETGRRRRTNATEAATAAAPPAGTTRVRRRGAAVSSDPFDS